MKIPTLLGAMLLLGAAGLQAAPPVVIVVPSASTQNYLLIEPQRPKPKTFDPYYYEVKTNKKKTTVKRDTSGNVTIKEKKNGKEKITIENRYGDVIYKETKKKKKKK